MQKFAQAYISQRAGIPVVDFLADELPLSKGKIKEAMQKGAVWLNREGEEPQRVRRAKDMVKLRDEVHIYYDEDFLAIKLPPLRCVESKPNFSVWIKPEGILEEPSLYGDHLSLARMIERDLPQDIDCFFVDPADGEITGLMVVGHTQDWSDSLDEQLANHFIEKDYRITVRGELKGGEELVVDGKAFTIQLEKFNAYNNTSAIRLEKAQAIESAIITQLGELGFPSLDEEQLQCCALSFLHPETRKRIGFHL